MAELKSQIIEKFEELQIDMDYTKSSLFNAGDSHHTFYKVAKHGVRFFSFILLLALAMNEDLCVAIGFSKTMIAFVAIVANVLNWLISEFAQSMEQCSQKNLEYKRYANEINKLLKESKIVLAIYSNYKSNNKKYQNFDDLDDYLIEELKKYTNKYNIICEQMPHIPEAAYIKTRKNFKKSTNIYTQEERNNI